MLIDGAEIDMIVNGQAHGAVAQAMKQSRFESGLYRPYILPNGERVVTVNAGHKIDKDGNYTPVYKTVPISEFMSKGIVTPVMNATTLRKDEWITIDRKVITAARKRLRAWSDLAASSMYRVNGMATSILENETMSDPGEAVVDMDAVAESRNDQVRFQLEGLPLPITHAGFTISRRKLETSRTQGNGLDAIQIEAAGRRVGEMVEKTLIGTVTGLTYGTAADYGRAPTVFGYTNFPSRLTKTNMTAPTGSNGPTVLGNWLALRDQLYAANFFGPFVVYTSTDYDQYLDNLFSTTEPSAGTLRSRLKQIEGIQDIRRLDYLTNTFTVLMVQMTEDVAQAVEGMGITTIQWESNGGMQLNFKVMAIQVPRLRADFSGNCGIAHGTTS